MIKRYYEKYARLEVPEDLERREIALQTYEGKMVRHLSALTVEELKRLALEKDAIDLYVSTASYEDPSVPDMEKKGWLRADLQFDIDVDHLEGCSSEYVLCGDVVARSGECEGTPVGILPLRCLEYGYAKARKLVKVLQKYLGIKRENVEIHFSGNRGFHVVARGTPFDEYKSDVRREIADFVTGKLLKKEIFCLKKNCLIPDPDDPGWRGRVGEELAKMLPPDVEKWGDVEDPEEVLQTAIVKASVPIDEQVTVDTSRLLRVPGSVHRKSALAVKRVDKGFTYDERLSPFVHFETEVLSKYDVEGLEVLGRKVSLRKGEKASLPGAIGAFLAAKGLVEILYFKEP